MSRPFISKDKLLGLMSDGKQRSTKEIAEQIGVTIRAPESACCRYWKEGHLARSVEVAREWSDGEWNETHKYVAVFEICPDCEAVILCNTPFCPGCHADVQKRLLGWRTNPNPNVLRWLAKYRYRERSKTK